MTKVHAKKHLGQHFLTDLNIAQKIVESLNSELNLPVLEVGPGMGVLTQFMVGRKNLKVIEIDRESVKYLHDNYPGLGEAVITGDFLKTDITTLFQEPFAIIGNFPYNISSQILFKVLDHKDQIVEVVCMLQREVATRIASPPGSKVYGILSVLLQAYFNIDYLYTVNEDVFSPPPKVKSAVIRLTRNEVPSLACSHGMFVRIVKTAFNQRRKMLRNSLKQVFENDPEFLSNQIFNLRPEQLTVNDFVFLAAKAES